MSLGTYLFLADVPNAMGVETEHFEGRGAYS